MTLLVPFDGSELAEAALARAAEFTSVFDEAVIAVTVIPSGDTEYARENGWIDRDEEFEMERIVSTLREQVAHVCPTAEFRHSIVGRHAPPGTISNRLRKVAREADASMVFIGSENAGHLVTAVSSDGATVAAGDSYDVVIVRHEHSEMLAEARDTLSYSDSNADSQCSE